MKQGGRGEQGEERHEKWEQASGVQLTREGKDTKREARKEWGAGKEKAGREEQVRGAEQREVRNKKGI